jgi:hypothetical protein
VAMSRLAYTGTRAHLNVNQDAFCQCVMAYDIIEEGAFGMRATLHTKTRATRKALGCQDRSRHVNKGYIGNAQHGRVDAHFLILKGDGFAHIVKCLPVSSDPLDTGSNPNLHFIFFS